MVLDNIKRIILQIAKNKRLMIAGIAVFVLLLILVMIYTIWGNQIKQKMLNKSFDQLEDYEFELILNIDQKKASEKSKQDENCLVITGTKLASTKQEECNIRYQDIDSRAVLSDGKLYVETDTLFTLIGPYILGDADTPEYYKDLYAGLFNCDVTMIEPEMYGIDFWHDIDNGPQWVRYFQYIINNYLDIYMDNATGEVEKVKDGTAIKFNHKQFIRGLNAISSYMQDSKDCAEENLSEALIAYSYNIDTFQTALTDDLVKWCRQLGSKENVITLQAKIQKYFEEKKSVLNADPTSCCEYKISKDDNGVTKALTIDTKDKTYTVSLHKEKSYHASIDNIPEEYESLGVQLEWLKKAYGNIVKGVTDEKNQ